MWVNELGGVTFRVDSGMGAGCEFIKVARRGTADFANEARRLRWAAPYLAVPRVLGVGVDGDWAWLHTDALPGLSAVHPRWRASPQVAVPALGAGLRTLRQLAGALMSVRLVDGQPAGQAGPGATRGTG